MSAAFPTIEQLLPMAQSLARRLARTPDEVDDLVQVGLFAFHKDLVRITQAPLSKTPGNHRGRQPYSQSEWMALARTTLRRAMWGYYTTAVERASTQTQSIDGLLPWLAVEGEQADLLELDEYFSTLERVCGPVARRIAENLVAPNDACAAAIVQQVRAKRSARRGRYDQRAPRARISHQLMRTTLGISKQVWSQELDRIRIFTRRYLAD